MEWLHCLPVHCMTLRLSLTVRCGRGETMRQANYCSGPVKS
jgi:hypothetical protein